MHTLTHIRNVNNPYCPLGELPLLGSQYWVAESLSTLSSTDDVDKNTLRMSCPPRSIRKRKYNIPPKSSKHWGTKPFNDPRRGLLSKNRWWSNVFDCACRLLFYYIFSPQHHPIVLHFILFHIITMASYHQSSHWFLSICMDSQFSCIWFLFHLCFVPLSWV